MMAPDSMYDCMMNQSPPAERLKRRSEFLRVAGKGRKTPAPGLVLQALKRDDDGPARLGFTVTKKVGNAVVGAPPPPPGGGAPRRLRAAAHEVLKATPVAGVDLVLIGRDGTRGRRFTSLVNDLRQAMVKLGAL
jgi:ribonuclease P protein component